MPEWQQRASQTAVIVGFIFGVALFATVALNIRAITTPTYTTTITIVSQAPSRTRAQNQAGHTARFVTQILESNHQQFATDLDLRPALDTSGRPTRSVLFSEAFNIRSSSDALLNDVANEIERRSAWPVTDLSKQGQFVDVKSYGSVHLWRIKSSLKAEGKQNQVKIQVNGPTVMMGYVDYLAFLLIGMLVISFGSLERSNNDPSSYPAGMNPFVVSAQMVFASLLACWIRIYWAVGHRSVDIGFLAITLLGLASIAWWLFKSRGFWCTNVMLVARNALTLLLIVLAATALFEGFGLALVMPWRHSFGG